jgi:hypothetical protein
METQTNHQRRYPGASPFEGSQEHIFFGRDKDIDKLQKLIVLRSQVLLYSKSGIGKTSLLNAGVMPRLKKKFLPVFIRFFAYNEQSYEIPVKKVIDTVKKAIDGFDQIHVAELEPATTQGSAADSFWFLFKTLQLAGRLDRKIILVFDQFE